MSILPYNKDAPLAMEIISYIYDIGFQIFDINELHVLGNGILFQIDIIFIRKQSCVWEKLLSKSGLMVKT